MQASPSSNDLFSACYVLLRGSTDMTPSPPPPVLTTWLPFNVRIRQATSWHVKAAGCPVLCEPRGARDEEMKESERIRPACSWTGGGQVTRIQLCAILEALFSRETHQGAWNLTKALLPELRTSVSKLDLVRETLPASTLYAPRAMSPPRAAIAAALAIAIALDGKKKLRPSGQKSGFENLVTPPTLRTARDLLKPRGEGGAVLRSGMQSPPWASICRPLRARQRGWRISDVLSGCVAVTVVALHVLGILLDCFSQGYDAAW